MQFQEEDDCNFFHQTFSSCLAFLLQRSFIRNEMEQVNATNLNAERNPTKLLKMQQF
jgi:hypothetical protein